MRFQLSPATKQSIEDFFFYQMLYVVKAEQVIAHLIEFVPVEEDTIVEYLNNCDEDYLEFVMRETFHIN